MCSNKRQFFIFEYLSQKLTDFTIFLANFTKNIKIGVFLTSYSKNRKVDVFGTQCNSVQV